MLNITVGSTSSHKLEAVRRACRQLGFDAKVSCVKASSGQNEQPVGFDETYRGALTRAQMARVRSEEDLTIGIESGIFRFGSITLDIAVIVVLCPDGRQIISTSPGIQFPEVYVKSAENCGFKKTTVGSVIQANRGGSFNDPHSTLTDGLVSRVDTLVAGLVVALRQI